MPGTLISPLRILSIISIISDFIIGVSSSRYQILPQPQRTFPPSFFMIHSLSSLDLRRYRHFHYPLLRMLPIGIACLPSRYRSLLTVSMILRREKDRCDASIPLLLNTAYQVSYNHDYAQGIKSFNDICIVFNSVLVHKELKLAVPAAILQAYILNTDSHMRSFTMRVSRFNSGFTCSIGYVYVCANSCAVYFYLLRRGSE